ncbi:A-kinase anchor protein 12-like, partial [Pituophis catenifer annectens]|uniref:A-kinase anchor protein 12-like n=1 Tax=Pituophis catenifer annectens TaxID=94852 RepID=UPI0039930906
SEEKEDQPSVSPSNDGFKKVLKLVGFKFTIKKDKTEKQPVHLLDEVTEVTEGSGDVAGDYKLFKTETVGEATQSEITASIEKTEEETQAEEMESKEAEIKNSGINSPKSPVNPSTAEAASLLRKFFTQSWAGFRKRISFRKHKEEQCQKEKQE